jgi:FtsX-like permease family
VGFRYRVAAFTIDQLAPAGEGRPVTPKGAVADLRVVGIVRYPRDLVPVVTDQQSLRVNTGELYLITAWWRRYGPDVASYGIGMAVRLVNGQADLPRLQASLRRLYGGEALAEGPEGSYGDKSATAGTRRAIRLESAALALFALLAALAALLLVGQTLGRQIRAEAVEFPVLRALGMTRGQLVGVAVVRAVPVAAAGAVLAVAGAVLVVAAVLACAVLAGWRAGRAPAVAEVAGAERRSRVAGALGAAGLPPAAVTGTRLALEPGRGRTAVPVRSALAAGAAAVCALTVAVTFGDSLARLAGDPRAYGVSWDVQVGNFADASGPDRAARTLAADPAVVAFRGALTGLGPAGRGPAYHAAVVRARQGLARAGRGRGPRAHPARRDRARGHHHAALGKRIGDTVEVSGAGEPQPLRVVGRVVVNLGDGSPTVAPGKGAIAHPDLWRRLNPPGMPLIPSYYFVRLDPAGDRPAALERLQHAFPATVVLPVKQPDVTDLERVGYLPGLLAGLVALLAVGTVTHALVTSVRRRRRDLATLKTLGFTRGQVSATVAWQATTFALVAAAVGVPLGVAGGHWAWRLVADQLGGVSGPVVPPLPVLAIAAGALAVANLAAAGPGWTAARIRPAVVLRAE